MNLFERAYEELELCAPPAPPKNVRTQALKTGSLAGSDASSAVHKVAVILGARLGGTHVLNSLRSCGVTIAGVYDASNSAPGLKKARSFGIPVYSGSWSQLGRMLNQCAQNQSTRVYVYLPTRDKNFIRFAHRQVAAAKRAFPRRLTLLQMDKDFGDYEPPEHLLALMNEN